MRQYLLFTLNRVKTNSTYSTWLFSPMRFALKEGVNRFLENPKYFNLVTPSFFISAQTGWTKSQRRWRRRRREAWWSTSGTPQVHRSYLSETHRVPLRCRESLIWQTINSPCLSTFKRYFFWTAEDFPLSNFSHCFCLLQSCWTWKSWVICTRGWSWTRQHIWATPWTWPCLEPTMPSPSSGSR